MVILYLLPLPTVGEGRGEGGAVTLNKSVQPNLNLLFLVYLFIITPVAGNPQLSVQFTDITEPAGVHFYHEDGRSYKKYFPETLGSGVALFDYDNDDDLDIYFVNGANLERPEASTAMNHLYRNNGDGTFVDVTEESGVGDRGYGTGVCVGDYDNDGWLDLYVTNYGSNVLYRNNGDGTFRDVTQEAGVDCKEWSAGCAFADVDGDGDLDLYIANYVRFSIEQHTPCRIKGILVYCSPRTYDGVRDVFFHNNGDGTFTEDADGAGFGQIAARGLGVVFGDYDNDGDVDLYVANDADQNFLYRNDGPPPSTGGTKRMPLAPTPPSTGGTEGMPLAPPRGRGGRAGGGHFEEVSQIAGVGFSEHGLVENGMGVDFGDYDNDGWLDLVVTNFQHQTDTVYHNDGDGFFSDVSYTSGVGEISLPYLAWGVNFFDYDHDGFLDLFVANGHIHDNVHLFDTSTTYAQVNNLFHNNRDGTFTDVAATSGSGLALVKSSRGSAAGDIDNDGDLDLVISNVNQTADILRNDGGVQSGTWLSVKLVGTASNRSAIGARVTAIAGALRQIREVRSGSSYLSQNDLRLHFGLGKHEKADLEVRWPSGKVEKFNDVEVNAFVKIIEGEGRLQRIRSR
ncbi:CRTAC1 family protein [Candidatus Poribacteria bacterium]|nr:CRTAC1 family protein [Candidatus Poribacteria bacterium]